MVMGFGCTNCAGEWVNCAGAIWLIISGNGVDSCMICTGKKSFCVVNILKYMILSWNFLQKSAKICTNCTGKVHKLCSWAA